MAASLAFGAAVTVGIAWRGAATASIDPQLLGRYSRTSAVAPADGASGMLVERGAFDMCVLYPDTRSPEHLALDADKLGAARRPR